MIVEKVSKDGNVLKIRILNEGHTFCNLLRREVWRTGKVKQAGYFIDHPQVGVPEFTVNAESDPQKLLSEAAKNAKKRVEDLKKEITKI